MNTSTSKASSRRSRRIRAAAIGITVCLGATLAACGSSNGSSSSASGSGDKVGVSLILKTLSNPYFVSMEKDAKTQAAKDNVKLTVAAGNTDGDTQTQITAIDNAISRGDKGILITTNGDAVNAALNRAKQAGLFVIALDTAPNPPTVADITYATDNEQAGKLDGQYAAAALNGKPAVIAMLDLFNNQVVSVDVNRDHGFLEGMGIDPGSKTENGKEAKSGKYTGGKGGTYTIACHQPTQGAIDGGRTAMENCLSANPNINVVYAINEPAGEGAYNALKAAGKEKSVAIYAIDGSCSGLKNVTSGEFAADAVQYPGKMAALGVSSIAKLARGGSKPSVTNGKSFYDTGTALVAAKALGGLTVQSPTQAASACWGS
ncbi:substrate-binding domain-containing protein [Streptomyces sp. Li-HN-5-11]|uniref:substrate-binding domain-containing protein n=1 Tax=Streptomyces sp. Li-HN-5-11 TaxID=3075432 RepID=UPI0028A9148C|nr:substrate-binding domain-containing protein [Streptomyces sp. Li-HN-5-11]WNM35855.1 substrate-binding domain-containing protein [Streptomyces sp. Li-HN-5-11]